MAFAGDRAESGRSADARRSMEDDAGWGSGLFVSFLNPLFALGNKRTLELVDLGPPAEQDRADLLYKRFAIHWEYEESLPFEQRSLWRPLFKTVGYWKFYWAIFLYAVSVAESFGPILILNRLVGYFQGTSDLSAAGLWIMVGLILFLPVSGAVLVAQSNILLAHIGLQFRNILTNKIYRKALLLSPAARQVSSTGQIINMFSTDTTALQRLLFLVNNIALALPTIAVALLLIYQMIGVATFVGLGMILITMPANGLVFGALNTLRRSKLQLTDYRVKLMNEILSGIRILKFYSWEEAFKEKINDVRRQELLILKRMAYLIATVFTMALQAVPVFMPVLIFFTFVKLGNTLDAATAFTAISLFNLIQFPFIFLPLGLAQYSQCMVSLQRLLQFFCADELRPYIDTTSRVDDVVIELKDATLGWLKSEPLENMDMLRAASTQPGKTPVTKEYQKLPKAEVGTGVELISKAPEADLEAGDAAKRSVETLRRLNVSIKKGELVAVVGPVGCGKSSLLSSLLGELNLMSGDVSVDGRIAYCDQRPWILNDTVEGNVLFGSQMDERRFDEALYASCLEEDIKMLPGGLQTQIGEKGINLSGGQKARVAVARAVYADADVYLLDDPLSAVDAHVAQFLFDECINGALKTKTRVLVTHHIHLLSKCDKVLVLVDGEVKAQGSYEDIVRSGIDLTALTPKGKQEAADREEAQRQEPDEDETEGAADVEETAATQVSVAIDEEDVREVRVSARSEEDQYKEQRSKATDAAIARKQDTRSTTLIAKEERKDGDVTPECYWFYIKSGGYIMFSLFVIGMLTSQVFLLLSSYWLQHWGTVAARREDEDNELSSQENVWYLNIYAALSAVNLVFYMVRSVFLAEHRLGASTELHHGLLRGTLNAPIAFFDTNPVGRILNRFSSDLQVADEEIAQTTTQLANSVANVLGAAAAIAGATKGTFLILLVPLAFLYNSMQKFFRATNTAVARLESISRSPIYADFAQALTGMTTIRAHNHQERFITKLESAVNGNSVANMTQQLSSQWLAIRLDFLGSLISFFIAVIAAATDGFIPAGFVALGLSYSFQMTTYLKFVVRASATLEAQMNSVERIMHYMNNIDQEQQVLPGREPISPPESWPEKGVVEAEDLQMRYRDGPLVLKSVNFKTAPSEKVGIAGRTGSGKSSMMIALFRIQELAGGRVLVDGLDTASVPLRVLRSRLGIIPQDPVMFSASVRFNLDPFEHHSDEEVWEVLDKVNMKDHVLSLPRRLQEDVAEGGDNFSVGQRQLICIGRALLRNPKILVLDEATASIDNENDQMIQQMVRTQFQKCTVLTIAHRLNTIVDSDRIMVLDHGHLKEMDAPAALLQDEHSLFHQLWKRHVRSHGEAQK